MSLGINTRRALLRTMAFSAVVAAQQAQAQRSPETDEGYRLWQDFSTEWNKFAVKLNAGVFDQKQWEKVRKSFHHLEERCSA